MSNCELEYLSEDAMRFTPAPGYSVVVFKMADQSAEVIVMDKNWLETSRLLVAPVAGKKTKITRLDNESFEVSHI